METAHFFLATAALLLWQGAAAENAESRLFSNLAQHSNKYVRPVKDHTKTLQVKVGLSLIRILDFDVKKQVLTSLVWMKETWKDAALKWRPGEYNGIQTAHMPHDAIWKPDIVLYNSATDKWDYPGQHLAVVSSDGSVLFIPPMQLMSTCSVDLTKFPFDEQTCILKLGSWTYNGHLMNISFYNDLESIDVNDYQANSEWDLVGNQAKRNEKYYQCCPEPYQDITFELKLRRRLEPIRNKLVAPSVVLALLIPVVFLLPTGSSEKTYLGAGVLIGLLLMSIHLEDTVSGSHGTVPITVVYNLACVILTAVCLMFAAFVNTVWAKTGDVPGPIRSLFLTVLGRLLCVGEEPSHPADQEAASEQKSPPATASGWRRLARVIDRLCFILFLVVTVIVTLRILL